VAVRVRVPVGVHFKHVHGGNVYNFMSSGTVQIIGDGVTHTYHAGQFFWEPVGHVHTLVGIKTAEFYGLQILTPHAAPVQAVQ
jgi:quercetin dioxygenase-like cupin family protein